MMRKGDSPEGVRWAGLGCVIVCVIVLIKEGPKSPCRVGGKDRNTTLCFWKQIGKKWYIYIYIEMSCVFPPLITTFLDFIFVMTDAVLQLLLSKEGCSWERLQWGVGKHWFSSELFMWVYVHCFPILYFLSYLGFFFPLQLIVVNSDGLVIIGVFLSLRKEAKLYIN